MPVKMVRKALLEEGRRDQMEPVPTRPHHRHIKLDPSGPARHIRKRDCPWPGGKPVGQQPAEQRLGPRPRQFHLGEGRDVHDPGALAPETMMERSTPSTTSASTAPASLSVTSATPACWSGSPKFA